MEISISDMTFKRLQALAIPFVDTTPESVILRLLDSHDGNNGDSAGALDHHSQTEVVPSFLSDPGSLAHTRVRRASFGRREIEKPNWNRVLRVAHEVAMKHLGSFDVLRRVTGANVREGRYEDEGFSYLPSVDISIQGLDSNLCWQNILRIAKRLNLPVTVTFEWHNNEKAANPGEVATIAWSPEEGGVS
jgi:hypothetical protein